ncbi:hypothetical protein A8F94_14765 [Bacillus sp. FJAT-27225]|uniref:hypothetical protein n=1 Tax=Bacillus sp. FJAT-27225 TaxID=1743144 RepID=UPI00080C335B|nr:hypothetical protein [Bacillus sp. FJAT-27225]OCA83997.1 hypothetical protein A8F94_14765 [Bacillus sp. FJAT-27225]
MIKTKSGTYDGDSWEEHCQLLLKTKYGEEGYQEMTAHTNGDLGIEGFTRTGIVFQCYCPDEQYEAKKLYEAQRAKISADLKKLISNKTRLQKFLGPIKIKKWVFLTPIILNKDIIAHCHSKALELRALTDMRELLDPEFDVLIHDEGFYANEIMVVKRMLTSKIEFQVQTPKEDEIIDWRKCESKSIEVLNRKIGFLFKNIDDEDARVYKTNKFVDQVIKEHLKGQQIISRMQDVYGGMYEKQVKIKSSIEEYLQKEVLLTELTPKEFLRHTLSKYKHALGTENFDQIFEYSVYEDLCNEAVSSWLIDCPLDFGGEI